MLVARGVLVHGEMMGGTWVDQVDIGVFCEVLDGV
jgi:hypothetical protein